MKFYTNIRCSCLGKCDFHCENGTRKQTWLSGKKNHVLQSHSKTFSSYVSFNPGKFTFLHNLFVSLILLHYGYNMEELELAFYHILLIIYSIHSGNISKGETQWCNLLYIYPETHLNLRDYALTEQWKGTLGKQNGKKEHKHPFLNNSRVAKQTTTSAVLYIM